MTRLSFAVLLSISFITGCKNADDKCSFQYTVLNNVTKNVKGCLVDSLEQGEWIVMDTLNNVVEKGKYEHGIKVGEWNYPMNKMPDKTIVWKEFSNKELGIATNVPENFKVANEDSFFVKFDDADTSRKLTLVIAMHNMEEEGIQVDSFYKFGENELLERGWAYKYQRNKFLTKGNVFYMNMYKIAKEGEQLEMLNLYGTTPNKRLVEVTVTFDGTRSWMAGEIFNSVILNLFIDSRRFVSPFDKIEVL